MVRQEHARNTEPSQSVNKMQPGKPRILQSQDTDLSSQSFLVGYAPILFPPSAVPSCRFAPKYEVKTGKIRRISSHILTVKSRHWQPAPLTCLNMQVEIRAVCPSAARYSVSRSGDPRKTERHDLFRENATGISLLTDGVVAGRG